MRPGAWPPGMSYPYGPEPYPTFGTDGMRFAHSLSEAQRASLALGFALDAAGVDEPERFLQDLFSLTEDKVVDGINDRARGNEERPAAEQFGARPGEKNGATRP